MKHDYSMGAQVRTLCAEAVKYANAGLHGQAMQRWQQALELDPNNIQALSEIGQHAFQTGELNAARVALQRVVELDGGKSQQWVNLAVACQCAHDDIGEEQAIRGALRADPSDLLALILRANLLERQGKTQQAANAYTAVLAAAPPLDRLDPKLRPAVMQAMAFKEKFDKQFGEFLNRQLESAFQKYSGENLKRFKNSFDIMVGNKKRFISQPAVFYYPQLTPIEFYDRAALPWLDQVEAATDGIRAEFLNILRTEQGFAPYLTYADDVPHHQFAELNNSPRWSAFHIYEKGMLVEANSSKCPQTLAMLAGCPLPTQLGRTPTAMFSLLKPNTQIPPHTGATNTRLVTHLPLIIPDACGFRVGNETRQWIPGKAWVFDDTIEHEAWNYSDKLRVVLIFDIWHPDLSVVEQQMLSALAEAIAAFTQYGQDFNL